MRYFIIAVACAFALLSYAGGADAQAIPRWKPQHYAQWLCIYRYENGGYGWSANTGNGYYGGLQMDVEFQRTYSRGLYERKGLAHHWTPLEQMWVAEWAWRKRGWWPWPNTARYCGLL